MEPTDEEEADEEGRAGVLSKPETTVTWTEEEIDFGPGVVLDPAKPLVIYDDTHADELLENVVVLDSSYVDLNDGGLAA